ncbi:hypothetical protein BC567DRAFT_248301 [Phyllosticta citribraziliensis]
MVNDGREREIASYAPPSSVAAGLVVVDGLESNSDKAATSQDRLPWRQADYDVEAAKTRERMASARYRTGTFSARTHTGVAKKQLHSTMRMLMWRYHGAALRTKVARRELKGLQYTDPGNRCTRAAVHCLLGFLGERVQDGRTDGRTAEENETETEA